MLRDWELSVSSSYFTYLACYVHTSSITNSTKTRKYPIEFTINVNDNLDFNNTTSTMYCDAYYSLWGMNLL